MLKKADQTKSHHKRNVNKYSLAKAHVNNTTPNATAAPENIKPTGQKTKSLKTTVNTLPIHSHSIAPDLKPQAPRYCICARSVASGPDGQRLPKKV